MTLHHNDLPLNGYVSERLYGAVQGVHNLAGDFRAWRHRRRTIRELRALDDRMLSDIGVLRYQIEDYVHGRLSSRS